VKTIEDYRRMAAECVRLAHNTSDPTNKAVLVEMAQSWLHLAKIAQDSEIVTPRDPEGE
jgi:hypothetical protein